MPVPAVLDWACNECFAAADFHVDPFDVRGQHVLVVQGKATPIALHLLLRGQQLRKDGELVSMPADCSIALHECNSCLGAEQSLSASRELTRQKQELTLVQFNITETFTERSGASGKVFTNLTIIQREMQTTKSTIEHMPVVA